MIFITTIGFLVLDFIYLFIKLCPTKHKVTFLSRQYNAPSSDAKMIAEQLKKDDPSVEIVYLFKMIDPGLKGKLAYVCHMFEQMYHIATSEVVLLDTYCIVVSCLHHKKSLKVIQMWHALGCLKKFGFSILDQAEGSSSKMAKAMHMHEGYDYVFASSKVSAVSFAQAFNVTLDKMYVAPLPRVDVLRDEERSRKIASAIYEAHPQLKEKKNVLYVPTFRKDGADAAKFDEQLQQLINQFNYDKYNLIVKLHPIVKTEINDARVVADKKFTSLDFACVADIVITDYSAVVYEMAIMGKDIYYFVFDQKEYVDNRDFYSNYDELPGPKCHSLSELLESIDLNESDPKEVKDFADRYIDPTITNCTKHICELVESCYR